MRSKWEEKSEKKGGPEEINEEAEGKLLCLGLSVIAGGGE